MEEMQHDSLRPSKLRSSSTSDHDEIAYAEVNVTVVVHPNLAGLVMVIRYCGGVAPSHSKPLWCGRHIFHHFPTCRHQKCIHHEGTIEINPCLRFMWHL